MFKVAIIGGSHAKDKKLLETRCINILRNKASSGLMVIGVGDDFMKYFTGKYRINTKTIITDFKTYGNNALKIRNRSIINDSDAFIVFNDGLKDTLTFYEMAKQSGKPVRFLND